MLLPQKHSITYSYFVGKPYEMDQASQLTYCLFDFADFNSFDATIAVDFCYFEPGFLKGFCFCCEEDQVLQGVPSFNFEKGFIYF